VCPGPARHSSTLGLAKIHKNGYKLDMHFKIKGEIREIEIIATGHGIKNLNRLSKVYMEKQTGEN
jgi:hypothetical protein